VAVAEVSSFSDGAAEYFGVACRYDKLKPRRVVIRPGHRGQAYDLLKGAYLGEWERIEVDDFTRSVRIFSFLPYRVVGLELQCGQQAVAGDAIRGTVRVETGGATPVRHVVHLDVQRPDGKGVRYLEQNLEAKDGEAAFVVPLALNEPSGQWTLRARDVATGVEANATVALAPGSEDKSPSTHGFQVLQHKAVPNWEEKPPTLAELVQEYPRASLHRRIDIVGRIRGEKPDQASLDLLRQAVQDPDPVLCWSAVTALGALGPKAAAAAPALATALRSGRGIRRDILATLRLLGAEAVREALPSIAECLEDPNPRVRFEALRTIAAVEHGTDEAVRRGIVECYRKHDLEKDDLDCNVLAAYLEALAVFPAAEAALPIYARAAEGFPMAIRLNEDERRTVQHGELVRTMGRFTYYEGELQRLHANNFTYRLMAAEALKKLGEKAETAIPAAIRALEAAAKEPRKLDSGTRIQIWLNRLPNPSAPADEDFKVAQALCQFLAGHGEKAKAALPVLKRLQELDPRLAGTARNAMRTIDPLAETGMELEKEGAGAETP
jgi:HEAT repeat protein